MLKQLIQRLLDSRTTAAEAAHSAMPKPETPTIVSDPVTDKAWHSLIAPFDGYFSCKGITKHMLIENSAAQWSGVTGLTSGGYMGFTLPMSKGSEVRYQLDHNSTGVIMAFSKIIGGGYNRFVRRALSCLRPSFNFLLRSFCKVNPNGLHPKAFQKGGCSCQLRLPNISLLTMDTLAFTKTLQTQENLLMFMPLTQLSQSLQGFAWALLKDLLHTQKLFLLEKAARSLSLMRQIQSKNYGSRRLSAAINNLEVGGALC